MKRFLISLISLILAAMFGLFIIKKEKTQIKQPKSGKKFTQ